MRKITAVALIPLERPMAGNGHNTLLPSMGSHSNSPLFTSNSIRSLNLTSLSREAVVPNKLPLALVVAGVFFSACGDDGDAGRLERIAQTVTVYRDAYGVPHVHGPTDASAAFGFAYAQAEDNFWQIEDDFIRAIGRAAEVHGGELLVDDWVNRGLEIPRLSREEYEVSSGEVRSLLDGFADGLNYYLISNPDVEPRLIEQFEPWYPLAFIRYLYYQRGFLGAVGIPRAAYVEAFRRSTGEPAAEQALLFPSSNMSGEIGSNSWAVMPAKSSSGNALLLINPHLPFFGPSQVYEGHVMSDDGWNFSGYTRFGFPLPYVGFNEDLGWASTDNAADLQDAFTIAFDNEDDDLAYRYGDGYRTATEWTDEIVIRTETGYRSAHPTFRKTHHGPILAVADGMPLAIRMAKFEVPGWLDQWYAMTKSRTLDQFKAAVSRLDMLFGNYLYADGEGNIYYVYNAAVPRRSESFDWTRPVDGSDPETEWRGYHSIDEIPQLLNPATGWLQNCNGTPFLSSSSGNLDPADYPSYMVQEGDNPRHRQARRILAGRDVFSFDQWAEAAYSTHLGEADAHVRDVVAEWERMAPHDPDRAQRLAEAVSLLREWDKMSNVESVAMGLYATWFEERRQMQRESPETEWLNLTSLDRAIRGLERVWGTWRVAWGDINRLQRRHTSGDEDFSDTHTSIPIGGAPGWAGAMFTFYAVNAEGQRRRYGVAGNTYVSIVEFGPVATARSLHTFGASADPSSPHNFDRAPLYAAGDFQPAWLTLEAVRANAASSYHPGDSKE
jgi:penicillin amidase